MNALFDLFGFLAVLVAGLGLVGDCLILGTVAFVLVIARPLGTDESVLRHATRLIRAAAICSAAAAGAAASMDIAILRGSLGLSWADIAGAQFVVSAVLKALCAAAIAAAALPRLFSRAAVKGLMVALCLVLLACALATTHAAARGGARLLPLTATALHMTGAAVWLGGLPCFRYALQFTRNPTTLERIARRYSILAATGVALIILGAAGIAVTLIGSPSALYGTAYGAMALTKSLFLVLLVLLGLGNFLAVRQLPGQGAWLRLNGFVEVEMGLGFAVLLLAASISTTPPAIDVRSDRATLGDITARLDPAWPRLSRPPHSLLATSQPPAGPASRQTASGLPAEAAAIQRPAPRNAADIAWSEYNHHWAGLLVFVMGVAALLQRAPSFRWMRHWPLLFLLLAAFLFVLSDPEVWPLGELGLLESLKDPEVAQHRIFVLLTAGFAFFEWAVRTGRLTSVGAALVFPALMAAGGTLLLTHSHAIADARESLLIEYSHLPMGVLGVVGGWTRWLEVRAPATEGRWAGWVWPVCFILIGALLVNYREA